MLIDASSYKNLVLLGLVNRFDYLETVAQVTEEMEMDVYRVHEVTENELELFLKHLKLIAKQTDRIISAEIKIDDDTSHTLTFNPKSSRGRKISLHYGEVYLLSRAISHPDLLLCDDESVIHLNDLLSGIKDIKLI
ncbi:MAG: hypothetical protein ACE5KT_10440 [Methanosarcinales archaeon]